MKKIIAVTAITAGFVFAGSASACSDLSFSTAMLKSGKQAQTGLTVAQKGDYMTGRNYVRRAKSIWVRAASPCASYLRTVRTQYGLALDYVDLGLTAALAGNYPTAMSSLKKGLSWISQANATMDAHGY